MSGPFTPQSLAERWACHPRTVRNLIRKGELRPFRIGALVRISMDEVERYEKCAANGSQGTAAPTPSSGMTRRVTDTAVHSARSQSPKPTRSQIA